MTFCDCKSLAPWPSSTEQRDGVLVHIPCGLPLRCEFSYMGPDDDPDADGEDHPATTTHIDYVVCDRHFGDAVNNVASRGWT